jgi:hypothetical protein
MTINPMKLSAPHWKRWLAFRCIEDADAYSLSADLYEDWRCFALTAEVDPMSTAAFGRALKQRFTPWRQAGTGKHGFRGIKLKEEPKREPVIEESPPPPLPEPPTFEVWRIGCGLFLFCPHCHVWHVHEAPIAYHGGSDGYVDAGCRTLSSPLLTTGYYIREIGPLTQAIRKREQRKHWEKPS